MNINELTIGQAREIAAMFPSQPQPAHNPYAIGKNYQIRTVTMIYTGKLVEVGPLELVLVDAAWIADTGRFADATRTQNYNEVEPYPDGLHVIIGRGAIVDAVEIDQIPRSQK